MPKKITLIGAVLGVAILGAAGYATVNPAFAADCRRQRDAGLAWAQQRAGALQDAVMRSKPFAIYQKALAEHRRRAQERQTKSVTNPVLEARQNTVANAPTSAELLRRERASWSVGQKIANGRAFDQNAKALGFQTRDQLASHIDRVIGYASSSNTKLLSGNRTAYWDDRTRCVVIVDPQSADGGTLVKPSQGYPYFKDLK